MAQATTPYNFGNQNYGEKAATAVSRSSGGLASTIISSQAALKAQEIGNLHESAMASQHHANNLEAIRLTHMTGSLASDQEHRQKLKEVKKVAKIAGHGTRVSLGDTHFITPSTNVRNAAARGKGERETFPSVATAASYAKEDSAKAAQAAEPMPASSTPVNKRTRTTPAKPKAEPKAPATPRKPKTSKPGGIDAISARDMLSD